METEKMNLKNHDMTCPCANYGCRECASCICAPIPQESPIGADVPERIWEEFGLSEVVPQESEGVASEVQRYEPFSSGTVPEGWPDEYVDSDDYDDLLEKYEQLAAHPSLVETAPSDCVVVTKQDGKWGVTERLPGLHSSCIDESVTIRFNLHDPKQIAALSMTIKALRECGFTDCIPAPPSSPKPSSEKESHDET